MWNVVKAAQFEKVEDEQRDKLNIEKFVENKHGKHQGKYSPTSHDISILAQYPRPQIL